MDNLDRIEQLRSNVDRARQLLDQYQQELDETLHEFQHREIDRLEEHLASTQHKFDDLNGALREAWQELGQQVDGVREVFVAWLQERRGKPD